MAGATVYFSTTLAYGKGDSIKMLNGEEERKEVEKEEWGLVK